MSVRVMSWVWENSASTGAERLVLLAIADSANDAGADAYPAMSTLARKAKLDKRTAQRAVRALVAAGAITVQENAGPRGTHRYRVLMTEGRQHTTRGERPPVANDHPGDTPPRHDATVAPDPTGGGISSPEGRQVATRTVLEPSKTHPDTSSSELRPDVDRLCKHLADRIAGNGSKRPMIGKKWRDAARLMLDADGREEAKVHTAIDWCQDHEFWRANILSMPKLREQYETLRLQAQRPSVRASPRRNTDDKVRDGLALAQRLATNQPANVLQIGAGS